MGGAPEPYLQERRHNHSLQSGDDNCAGIQVEIAAGIGIPKMDNETSRYDDGSLEYAGCKFIFTELTDNEKAILFWDCFFVLWLLIYSPLWKGCLYPSARIFSISLSL